MAKESAAGPGAEGELLWEPSAELRDSCRLSDYCRWLEVNEGLHFDSYQSLWEWSVGEPESFWESLWRYFQVLGSGHHREVLQSRLMPGAEWFPGTKLNYAEHALRELEGGDPRVIAVAEDGSRRTLTGSELRAQVAAVAGYLRRQGVGEGDRVAAYLPNVPEAVVGLLACASLGAIWSSCSPDFGAGAVLDRFRQIAPVVLIAADGYRYGGRAFDRRQVVDQLREGLPSLRRTLEVPLLAGSAAPAAPGIDLWAEVLDSAGELRFREVPFSHPLWVVYSSGTTGLPKPIVQSHGGILLEHLKALGLHADVGPPSRFFWFTTTGWMMWNYLLGGLLLGATVVLYDGSPVHPGPDRLWHLIPELGITHFGTSAGHIGASLKAGLRPGQEMDLSSLRFLGSTGSPLSPEGFAWAYRELKSDLWVSSLSGGTDLCTAFLLGCPWLPVRSGVIQCRGLGARVEAFDPGGRPLSDEVGELVLTLPMPSMPVGFWGDQDGSRYRAAYFDTYPGVWRHGDWVRIRADGGAVIYGRSDSTINRLGVRMGTAEIYRVVEEMDEVADSLVVDAPLAEEAAYMPLFVVLSQGRSLDQELVGRIRTRLRERISPRHVPDEILEVAEIPRTLSGKKLEIPVKRILQGDSLEGFLSLDAIANPASLDAFLELAARRRAALSGGGRKKP